MNEQNLPAVLLGIASILLLSGACWLTLKFAFKKEKGERITAQAYRKTRTRSTLFAFLGILFLNMAIALSSSAEHIALLREDMSSALINFACCPSMLAFVIFLAFRPLRWGILDAEE